MNSGTEGTGGEVKRQVGDLWKVGGTWYEQTAAGAWELPVIEIEGVTFGVRIVYGELLANAECLPRLAGEEDAEQVQALRAELVRAWRDELGQLLGVDEIDMDRLCRGGGL